MALYQGIERKYFNSTVKLPISVRKGDEKNKAVKALVKVLQSDDVKKFIDDKYNGAVVPVN